MCERVECHQTDGADDAVPDVVMIRSRDEGPQVYLCVETVDGRKQINGLAALVQLWTNHHDGHCCLLIHQPRTHSC